MARHPPAGRAAQTKPRAASERAEAARTAWRTAVAPLAPEHRVLVAARGTNSARTRRSGWAPHAQRATGSGPRTQGKHTPRVAALAPDGVPEPGLIAGALKTEAFAWDLQEHLAPTLKPRPIVVLDQLSVHTAASSRPASAARHCTLRFLPPSAPDVTPLAPAFSTINALLRGLGARTKEALWEALRVAVEAITPAEALAWFAHAGSARSAPAT
ncbi:MAG TPA: transposase [Ktedonobacterales bacterium]|nr:transposase [Ktedonobacterales bacterium]